MKQINNQNSLMNNPVAHQRAQASFLAENCGILESEWGREMVSNMDKMARDEEYRKTIAKDLS